MWFRILLFIFVILALSVGLTWISNGYESVQGWFGFLVVIILAAGLLFVSWLAIWSDPAFRNVLTYQYGTINSDSNKVENVGSSYKDGLCWLLLGATILRLGVGVLWYRTLPNLGYGSSVELSGYVMADAYNRDMAAWDLAQSGNPLLSAFSDYRSKDQYGGMLFGSALVYRYLGGEKHYPLQIVILTATISALVVLFSWAFARRIWDGDVAKSTAWIVALFPDAVLLGSSQMREAIMMSLVMIAFYGLIRIWQDRTIVGGVWMVTPILIAFPLSPLFGVMLAVVLGIFSLFLGGSGGMKDWRVWVVLTGLLVFGLVIVAFWGEQILPGGASNPLELLQRWLKQAGRWQAYNAEHASGWMQKIFRNTPHWTHTWLLLIYGVARPFLPAALFDSAAIIWQGIAIWRSVGWAVLLPILIVAPLIVIRRDGWRSPTMGITILIWIGILISSYRGGGDQWDNPRYRVIWIGLQGSLAAWVLVTQRRYKSPWARRVLVSMGLILIWWVPWYLRRVTALPWPIQDVFVTLGLGVLSVLLYLIADFFYTKRCKMNKKCLSSDS